MSPADVEGKLETLLEFLKLTRGFDFTGYKPSTLYRRVCKRMQEVQIETISEYMDYLEVHQGEFTALFNTILINVTEFFRDPPAWEYLRQGVLPQILARKGSTQPVRAWSAGCATGEEAYTLAMLLAESMGEDAFHDRVKIYATDVDEEALNQGRHASYDDKAVIPVPAALREKYFEPAGNRLVFRNDLRRALVFGRHDLIQDAPISRVDLLICRNTLMYFNAETQGNIMGRFHFALNEGGFLFLGKAEMVLHHATLFAPVEIRHRIFARLPQTHLRDRGVLLAQETEAGAAAQPVPDARLRDHAFTLTPLAQIVVDQNGCLALTTERARTMFGLASRDVGRPLQDLEISFRPVELRSLMQRAAADHRPVIVTDVEHRSQGGETQYLEVQVIPVQDVGGRSLGVSVCFHDLTRAHQLRDEVQRSAQDRDTALEELQSANEELETTNEELQSTVEELQTTNEELQSTNEEMETMNEELQATNEELRAASSESRKRVQELDQVNAFLESTLASVRLGVVVVDENLRIGLWNDRAEDLWGLRAEEVVGRSLKELEIGLPVEDLEKDVRSFLMGEGKPRDLMVDAINRRGKTIKCRVGCTLRLGPQKQRRGAVLLMEEIAQ